MQIEMKRIPRPIGSSAKELQLPFELIGCTSIKKAASNPLCCSFSELITFQKTFDSCSVSGKIIELPSNNRTFLLTFAY